MEITAREYGKQAFLKGMRCIPALDNDFLENCIKGQSVGGDSLKLMKEWAAGWTQENLKDTKEVY